MFQWYRDAEVCFAYLRDVYGTRPLKSVKSSDWFTRGWTLQELVAPDVVVFFSRDWTLLGHKCPTNHLPHRHSMYGADMNMLISEITNINHSVLEDFDNIRVLPIGCGDEKLQ